MVVRSLVLAEFWQLPLDLSFESGDGRFALLAGAGILALVVIVLAVLLARRRRRPERRPAPPPQVDLDALAASLRQPSDGPRLTVYGGPVRLALVVLAPIGRGRAPAALAQAPALLDDVAAGLGELLGRHGATVKLWPPQLSAQGFAAALFTHVALPGNRGKGSPWCTVAGRFESADGPWLVGLTLLADKPNPLGQIMLEPTQDWPAVLRVET